MTPTMLRQLWSLVEETQTAVLLGLDDTSLLQWLLQGVAVERSLDCNETNILTAYIRSKLMLIRDLAQARCANYSL